MSRDELSDNEESIYLDGYNQAKQLYEHDKNKLIEDLQATIEELNETIKHLQGKIK